MDHLNFIDAKMEENDELTAVGKTVYFVGFAFDLNSSTYSS